MWRRHAASWLALWLSDSQQRANWQSILAAVHPQDIASGAAQRALLQAASMKMFAPMIAALCLVTSGCGGIGHAAVSVPYTAQPERIEKPREELRSLFLAGAGQGCVVETEFMSSMMIVRALCSYMGVSTHTLRFDRIHAMELQRKGKVYSVYVAHEPGSGADFIWSTMSLEDAKLVYDSIVLLQKAPKKTEATTR